MIKTQLDRISRGLPMHDYDEERYQGEKFELIKRIDEAIEMAISVGADQVTVSLDEPIQALRLGRYYTVLGYHCEPVFYDEDKHPDIGLEFWGLHER